MITTIARVSISIGAIAFGIFFLANMASDIQLGFGLTLLAIGGLGLVPRT